MKNKFISIVVIVIYSCLFSALAISQEFREVKQSFYFTKYSDSRARTNPKICKLNLHTGIINEFLDSATIKEQPIGNIMISYDRGGRCYISDTNRNGMRKVNGIPTPDGMKQVYFLELGVNYPCCNTWDFLFISDIDNKNKIKISEKELNVRSIQFTKDGSCLFYITYDDSLRKYDIEKGENSTLCYLDSIHNMGTMFIDFDLSPNGNILLINERMKQRLFIINLTNNNLIKYNHDYSTPFFIDNSRIVYSKNSNDTNNLKGAIYTSNLNGSDEQRISPNDEYLYVLSTTLPFINNKELFVIRLKDFKKRICDLISLNYTTKEIRVIMHDFDGEAYQDLLQAIANP
ncbi:MAG: hypothetical protein V1779_09990 [bacterium]